MVKESISVKPIHVRYKGTFDFEGLYKLVYKWYEDRQYEMQEKRYKNKVESPWGYETEVNLTGFRKVDSYYKYDVDINFIASECSEVEIKGKKLFEGRIILEINAEVTRDYSGRFKNKILDKMYKFMTKRDFEFNQWDPLYQSIQGLQQSIKKHLKMYADTNY